MPFHFTSLSTSIDQVPEGCYLCLYSRGLLYTVSEVEDCVVTCHIYTFLIPMSRYKDLQIRLFKKIGLVCRCSVASLSMFIACISYRGSAGITSTRYNSLKSSPSSDGRTCRATAICWILWSLCSFSILHGEIAYQTSTTQLLGNTPCGKTRTVFSWVYLFILTYLLITSFVLY